MGEVGDDSGKFKRKFFWLLTRTISDTSYLTPASCVQHNSVALQVKMQPIFMVLNFCFWLRNNVYTQVGELVTAPVTQSGSAVHLFNDSVYKYICGSDVADIKPAPEEIPDFEIRELMDQVCTTYVFCIMSQHCR